jgi:hypothetical protein
LAKCQFPTTKYHDYESHADVPYNCDIKEEEDILPSGLCIFHDKNYLQVPPGDILGNSFVIVHTVVINVKKLPL